MARKREMFDWVEIRLQYWGKWIADGSHGLGYPGRTVEGRLSDGEQIGLTTNYRDHSPNIEFCHKEQETDRAISSFPDSRWKRIVTYMHVDGKKPSQVAYVMNASQNWVTQNYSQILAYLAGAIREESDAKRIANG